MRCKGCGYSLWNVPGRTCPECGRGFSPCEFEFRPNMVEFCCAGCGQQYYGTDRSGLPVPREFDCVRCAARCTLDSMVLRLAPGVTDEQAEVFRVPWESREGGRMRAFLATVRDGMTRPSRLGKAIGAGTGTSAAWGFLVALLLVALLPTAITIDVVVGWIGYMEASGTRTGASAFAGNVWELVGTTALVTAGAAIVLALAVLLCAGACFGVLRLLRERPDWGRVWASYAYSTAPAVLFAVPCFGPYCGSTPVAVWFLACVTIVLVQATAITAWKVAAAVLGPVFLALGAATAVFVLVVVPQFQAASAAAANAASAAAAAAQLPPAPDDAPPTDASVDASPAPEPDPEEAP